MSGLKVFDFGDNEVEIIFDETETAWFRGTHVCRILEFSNPTEAIKLHAIDYAREFTISEGRSAYFVTEPGLYALIFRSKSIAAKKFQKWVFEDVLPKLRRGEVSLTSVVPTTEQLNSALAQTKTEVTNKSIELATMLEAIDQQVRSIFITEAFNLLASKFGSIGTQVETKVVETVKVIAGADTSVLESTIDQAHLNLNRSGLFINKLLKALDVKSGLTLNDSQSIKDVLKEHQELQKKYAAVCRDNKQLWEDGNKLHKRFVEMHNLFVEAMKNEDALCDFLLAAEEKRKIAVDKFIKDFCQMKRDLDQATYDRADLYRTVKELERRSKDDRLAHQTAEATIKQLKQLINELTGDNPKDGGLVRR
ncbi:BRO-N domain-containing protein [Chroococcidiopsis sp.]|uniref:BRO-N domain-containing protein n=1 Tax=Chroococcidiopsis sp. TaxID=3088168 RepID=UPI003F3A8CA0